MVRAAPLGQILIDAGVLNQANLEGALALQKTDKRRLGEIVIELGFVNPHQLAQLLSHQLSCPWISLAYLEITHDVLALVAREVALEHRIVPVHLRTLRGEKVLFVATDDPTDTESLASCATLIGMPLRPMVAVTAEIKVALARHYGGPQVPEVKRPLKPPPPIVQARASQASIRVPVDEHDVVETAPVQRREKRAPTVLALNAPPCFLAQCKEAASGLGARVIHGGIGRAGELVAEHRPCAIMVTDDVYAFDRSGLNRLALEHDAHLVVWNEEADGSQLRPLLSGAINRWGRSSYEKGAVVDGRYELLRDMGSGADGDAVAEWEVRHVRTARRSLLTLGARTDERDEPAERVRRAQQALARVTHPGALELRDAGTTELGDPYIVTEALGGRTLKALIAARSKLLPEDACAILLQVAQVLVAAHAVGVIHHQVSSENLVIVRDGYGSEHVKLTTWCLATTDDAAGASPSVDLQGLGECAVEALTGRRPKAGGNVNDLNDLNSVTDLAEDGVSEPIIRVFSSLLAMKFGSAKELTQALLEVAPNAHRRTRLLDASRRSGDVASGSPADIGVERRRHPRAAYRTPVRMEAPGTGSLDGRCEDISSGGLLIGSKGMVKAGTEVSLRFALPIDGRVVSEAAKIKWARPARMDDSTSMCALGVELTDPAQETRRQIERYIALMGT